MLVLEKTSFRGLMRTCVVRCALCVREGSVSVTVTKKEPVHIVACDSDEASQC